MTQIKQISNFKLGFDKQKELRFAAEHHSFHLVDSSLYPFLTSITLFFIILGVTCTIHTEIYSSITNELVESLLSYS
jgi:hypothetical protein